MNYDYVVLEDGTIIPTNTHLINRKKEPTMYTTNQSLIAQIAATEAELAKMRQQLEAQQNPYGEDLFKNGTVLVFNMQYSDYGKRYDFAVLKSDGRWFPTGKLGTRGQAAQTWEQLCSAWKRYGVRRTGICVTAPHRHI